MRSSKPLCAVLLLSLTLTATQSLAPRASARTVVPIAQSPAALPEILSSSSTSGASGAAAQPSAAASDTVYLYGGPDTLEGKFEDGAGLPGRQGWLSVDLSDHPSYWQLSTFNAANLHANGPGNLAMWCGRSASDEPDWPSAPGYGNSWSQILEWTSGPLSDPSLPRTVSLDFYFNYDLEPFYDYVTVRYLKAGAWIYVAYYTGSNKSASGVFDPPGVHFSNTSDIVFDGNDYAGENQDEIVLQIHVESDATWSDQDGFWDSEGAVQVDDITVTYTDGSTIVDFLDFQGAGPFSWLGKSLVPKGDFSKVIAGLTDLDPCVDNDTPQFTFIDDGSPPNNAPGQSTGGSPPTNPPYGVPGGWSINMDGGLRHDGTAIENEIWSPPIAWDAPGPDDDGPGWRAFLRFDVFSHHCCVSPSYFWQVRTSTDGLTWSPWAKSDFLFWGAGAPRYDRIEADLTAFPPDDFAWLQISLSPVNYQPGWFTPVPGPFFDNVAVLKVKTGHAIAISSSDLLRDGFPAAANLDVTTPADRDQLDIAIESAGGLNGWGSDSLVVTIRPILSTELPDPAKTKLVWVLDKNPLFEDAIRSMPAGSTTIIGGSRRGWDQWTGELVATEIVNYRGIFDPPDVDFLYPGDEFRYYIFTESAGGVASTLPTALDGFVTGEGWPMAFTVRGLPSILDATGTQPSILWLSYWGAAVDGVESHRVAYEAAFREAGFTEGVDYDRLALRYSHGVENEGLAAIGAQSLMDGYHCMILTLGTFGPSSDEAEPTLLQDWHARPGDRAAIYFGPSLFPIGTPAYKSDVMRVEEAGPADAILDGQRSPVVLAEHAGFEQDFAAARTCSEQRFSPFQTLRPLPGAVRGHGFQQLLAPGTTYPDAAASVVHERIDGEGDRIVDLVFPFDLHQIQNIMSKASQPSARALLLGEALTFAGAHAGGLPTLTPPRRAAGIYDLVTWPNPFNPRATVRFTLGQEGRTTVGIYDARGTLVRTLYDGTLPSGPHGFTWGGSDDAGVTAASGVYFANIKSNGQARSVKLVLIK